MLTDQKDQKDAILPEPNNLANIPESLQSPKLQKKRQIPSNLQEWGYLILGVVIVALGIHFFKFPNHFAMGGVAGIAVVVGALVPFLSPAMVSAILNIALLLVGYAVFGRKFAVKTAVATVLLSILQVGLDSWIPVTQPLTDDTLLELFFAIICSAVGSAMLFNQGASTGGTDIIAMIVRRFSTLDIGKALLVTDFVIGASTFFIFDVKTGLYSIGGILLKGVIVDSLIEGFNRVKYFTIICSDPEKITNYITHNLHRGVTQVIGEGVYSGQKRTILLCVVDRFQSVALRQYIKSIEPSAFMMVTNTSEIIGRGFHVAT